MYIFNCKPNGEMLSIAWCIDIIQMSFNGTSTYNMFCITAIHNIQAPQQQQVARDLGAH